MITYEEAIDKIGDNLGEQIWHDYMCGAYLPSSLDYNGAILAISYIYNISRARVILDVDKRIEFKKGVLTEEFKSKRNDSTGRH
jgi:hypothetical protein